MNQSNLNDFYEFEKYHKNKYNRLIHIFCFLIGFVAFCFLFNNNYIKYGIIILYIGIIFFIYNNINDSTDLIKNKKIKIRKFPILVTKILVILLIIFFIFKYINIKSKIILIIIIILTYIIPELSHIYFNEKTYLYNRLNKEKNIFMAIIQIINHCINLVPYCMLSK
jgi:uncharacterized membrane protein